MFLEKLRSLRWVDYFLFALVSPKKLYMRIHTSEKLPIKLCVVVPVLVACTDSIASNLVGTPTPFFFYRITYGWVFLTLLIIVQLLVGTSLMDFVGQILGFEGRAKELICILSFSLFPKVFFLPLMYVISVINFAPLFFYTLIPMILFLWSLFIAVKGISEMRDVGFGKSLLIYASPYLILGVLFFFISLTGLVQIGAFLTT